MLLHGKSSRVYLHICELDVPLWKFQQGKIWKWILGMSTQYPISIPLTLVHATKRRDNLAQWRETGFPYWLTRFLAAAEIWRARTLHSRDQTWKQQKNSSKQNRRSPCFRNEGWTMPTFNGPIHVLLRSLPRHRWESLSGARREGPLVYPWGLLGQAELGTSIILRLDVKKSKDIHPRFRTSQQADFWHG